MAEQPPGEEPEVAWVAPIVPTRSTSRRRINQTVRQALGSKSERRKAYLLREVLGAPVALRPPSMDRPT